ncbi:NUDIX domain-containing protein [Lentzea sp. NPDC058450]|uniref:NUDIX hydrolase n=1 Tax=Lentzea sp. NPDC058450 TaxID=3346505 RepID=UPI0036494D1E
MEDRRERITVLVAADLVVLTIRDGRLQVLVVVRGTEPYKGMKALPGGFLRPDESAEDAAQRELAEETGLDPCSLPLRQLRTYSRLGRDPRGRVVSVVFLAVAPELPMPETAAGNDAAASLWAPVDATTSASLAFDHAEILADAVAQAGEMISFTTLAAKFCAETFTMKELRQVFEAIWGVELDPANFLRAVTNKKNDFVVPAGGQHKYARAGRPATLYRMGQAELLDQPIRRPLRRDAGEGV